MKQVPLPPIPTFHRKTDALCRVTDSSSTSRLGTALVALLFGLGWGMPIGHASCAPTGPSSSDHCDASGSSQHCEGEVCTPSAVCLTHHASQEALAGESPSPDLQEGGGAENSLGVDAMAASVSALAPNRPVVSRARRLHVSVGVWLE